MLILRTDRGYSRTGRVKTLAIIFAILIVLFFILKPFLQPFLLRTSLGISNIFTNKSLVALQIENEDLKNRLAILESNMLTSSSTELLIQMGATDFIRASIIIKNMNSVYGNMYINRGAEEGVKIDSVVFVAGLYPVAKVVGVGENISRIELFTGSGKKQGGLLRYASNTEELIELEGDGSYGFFATVPASSQIKNGDKVYFAENTDFVLGEVVGVGLNENENNKIIRIKSFYSVTGTASVYIQK